MHFSIFAIVVTLCLSVPIITKAILALSNQITALLAVLNVTFRVESVFCPDLQIISTGSPTSEQHATAFVAESTTMVNEDMRAFSVLGSLVGLKIICTAHRKHAFFIPSPHLSLYHAQILKPLNSGLRSLEFAHIKPVTITWGHDESVNSGTEDVNKQHIRSQHSSEFHENNLSYNDLLCASRKSPFERKLTFCLTSGWSLQERLNNFRTKTTALQSVKFGDYYVIFCIGN
ncbi:hypothetical protein K503DRAFT_783698 [Rhizopogon vinicolor AM-OR11-026]|uniref:Uncharacterized protein n=1 Tax=Rhizopogon vinicolor AM-OR11-026 TaxID=1314800 RepID=A0A1B7MXL0_9AGAM|nr:hypothetical protein K503DRAFT_783698 [Rhizopogon vinicolor AM-OR11-026]